MHIELWQQRFPTAFLPCDAIYSDHHEDEGSKEIIKRSNPASNCNGLVLRSGKKVEGWFFRQVLLDWGERDL